MNQEKGVVVPDRDRVLAARAEWEDVRTRNEDAKKQLDSEAQQAKAAYREELYRYLGIRGEIPVARYAEKILDFAEQEGIDPEWLCQEVGITLRRAERIDSTSIPDPKSRNSEDPADYYHYALSLITRSHGNHFGYSYPAMEAFKEAERLAQEQEALIAVPQDQRMSVGYRWLHQNLDALFQVQRESWISHY